MEVSECLQNARNQLLDLTLRNRLLNHKETKSRSILIIDESIREIYDILVIKNKSMQFHAKKELGEAKKRGNNNSSSEDNSTANIWTFPEANIKAPDHYFDQFLETGMQKEQLQKRLFYIFQESHSILEEQGYNVLYLALGFLEWTESENSTLKFRAPLILIPVELNRDKILTSFKLTWTGDDIATNISLQAKLKEQNVVIPDFEMPDDKSEVDTYFSEINKTIHRFPDWKILDEIYLDFFSFSKFVMYKDLDPTTWPEDNKPVDHPLIQSIFNRQENASHESSFDENDVDKKLPLSSTYHILDADSSQIAVIEDIKSGKNLVVEGPPGTGKSQTIANAIAENLANGRTVLFISEKMAALKVVKERLDAVGLGDYCLELHSKKTNKKQVLEELNRTFQLQEPKKISCDEQINELEHLKAELNAYVEALSHPVGIRELSPYELFGKKEAIRTYFQQQNRSMPRVAVHSPDRITSQEWEKARNILNTGIAVIPAVLPITNNVWKQANPDVILPVDIEQLDTEIGGLKNTLQKLEVNIKDLVELTGINPPESLKELQNRTGATRLIVSSDPVDKKILLNPVWNTPNEAVTKLIESIQTYRDEEQRLLSIFHNSIFDTDIEYLRKEFQIQSNKNFFAKLVTGKYKKLKRDLLILYKESKERSDNTIISDLKFAAHTVSNREKIRSLHGAGYSLFGSLWKDEKSDPQALIKFSNWISSFKMQLMEKVFTEQSIEVLSQGASPQKIEHCVQSIQAIQNDFQSQYSHIVEKIHMHSPSREEAENLSFNGLETLLSQWKSSLPTLIQWSHYSRFRTDLKKTVASPIIDLIESGEIDYHDLIQCFEGNYFDALLKYAFQCYPALSGFHGESHNQKIKRFSELDKIFLQANRQRLAGILHGRSPKAYKGLSSSSEMGVLLAEFNRKRGQMPIRKLMSAAGGVIQKIKPCFMMGPLSVAQYLDPRTVKFDVVIFDEASQVKPHDALGTLLRGKQAVVIGDSRQLPPTSFFEKMMEAEEIAEEGSLLPTDTESILNLCRATFATKILRWHYRSRHESLIALSNQEFYDNKLYVYPSPAHETDEFGLKFVYLPSTVYDRGKSRMNRGEAREVAQAVLDHFMRYPKKSLGVGTFSIQQQEAIQEAIEAARITNPTYEDFFTEERFEHFFVKNLETIQGDERDVIFISVGYGRDTDGKLSSNFGPLNQEGGERRLNVLITRARQKCVVFSNFKSSELNITDNPPFGVRVLKNYLAFAESGRIPCIVPTGGDFESPFEESVHSYLKENGFEIHKQVGCAGFRLDLAVVHPSEPGRYALGIECDGSMYHSSPVARDRDRLRQQILEGLGWNIYRVWSTDWYRNVGETQARLLSAVREATSNADKSNIKDGSSNVIESVAIERKDETEGPGDDSIINLGDDLPKYCECNKSAIGFYFDMDTANDEQVIYAVKTVVEAEGPIHIEECVNRFKKLTYIPKMTKKVRAKITTGIELACFRQIILKKSETFLWPKNHKDSILRKRNIDNSIKMDYICDEEIEEAIKYVLAHQFTTRKSAIPSTCSQIFGIKPVRAPIIERYDKIMTDMISNHKVVNDGEYIRLPEY